MRAAASGERMMGASCLWSPANTTDQGLTLLHFSAQPDPFLVNATTQLIRHKLLTLRWEVVVCKGLPLVRSTAQPVPFENVSKSPDVSNEK